MIIFSKDEDRLINTDQILSIEIIGQDQNIIMAYTTANTSLKLGEYPDKTSALMTLKLIADAFANRRQVFALRDE